MSNQWLDAEQGTHGERTRAEEQTTHGRVAGRQRQQKAWRTNHVSDLIGSHGNATVWGRVCPTGTASVLSEHGRGGPGAGPGKTVVPHTLCLSCGRAWPASLAGPSGGAGGAGDASRCWPPARSSDCLCPGVAALLLVVRGVRSGATGAEPCGEPADDGCPRFLVADVSPKRTKLRSRAFLSLAGRPAHSGVLTTGALIISVAWPSWRLTARATWAYGTQTTCLGEHTAQLASPDSLSHSATEISLMKSKAASGWTFTSKNVAKGHAITSTDPRSTVQNWPMPDSGSPCMPKRWNPTGLAKSQGPPNVRTFSG